MNCELEAGGLSGAVRIARRRSCSSRNALVLVSLAVGTKEAEGSGVEEE